MEDWMQQNTVDSFTELRLQRVVGMDSGEVCVLQQPRVFDGVLLLR